MASSEAPATTADFSTPESSEIWMKVVTVAILSAIVIFTVTSNLTVLIAFYLEKKLRSTFTYFVANLAVTDFLAGLLPMTFYSINSVLGYWPFGKITCGLWTYCDFVLVFTSVLTLIAISVDRYWALGWSNNYRKNNTTRKSSIIVSCIRVTSLALSLPPVVAEKLNSNEQEICHFDLANNKVFGYGMTVVGQLVPCIVILFCYIRVFMLLKRRYKVRQDADLQGVSRLDRRGASTSGFSSQAPVTSSSRMTLEDKQGEAGGHFKVESQCGKQIAKNPEGTGAHVRKQVKRNQDKIKQERRVFINMSFILITFLICWLPYYVAHFISIIAPDVISVNVFAVFFWMTYINSTLNPIVYAVSNPDFRGVMKRIITCKRLT